MTKSDEPFSAWTNVGITSITGGVDSVKSWFQFTYSRVEIPTDDRQQLRLKLLQRVLYLSGRVSFWDVSPGQR